MDSSPARKWAWELHAIVCLFLITFGIAVSRAGMFSHRLELEHFLALAGMVVLVIGLFRGSRIAWWASAAAFAIMTVATTMISVSLIREHGFRAHRILLSAHATTAYALATFGLLLSSRLRRAYPDRAMPLFEDLPIFRKILIVAVPLLLIMAAIFSLAITGLFTMRRFHGERSASTMLKILASAEADYRANDRNWDQVNDFWTGDVQGLYGMVPSNGKEPIKLLHLSEAAADGNPVKGAYPPIPADSRPQSGAWLAALVQDHSVQPPEPYRNPGTYHNPSRFGFIAYPDDYIAGLRVAFIVNENNRIFRRRLTGDIRASDGTPPGPLSAPGFTNWPGDDELKAHWSKLD